MPDAITHPTPQELTAFGLGKLPERAAAGVAAHLESCPGCRQAVAAVLPDSFLDKVRAASPGGSSFPPNPPRPGNALSSAGRPATPAPAPNLPPELANHPKYRILRELGRGGMGVVYQARQTGIMDRQVVIKVINRALLDQPTALERFLREVQAAAQLSHANIVTAYDAEQAGELHMLVMEFVPGQNLAEVLQTKGPLPVANACHYMRQAALGLQHAHERAMVHRDIKPQNLMLMPKGQVKILDFGLAKIVRERSTDKGLTASDAYMGTPDFCAPEQATDARTADIRADLYSLGCTLYCLLAGRPPFQEDTAVKTILAHIEKDPQPLPELRPDVPAELWQVVNQLLAKDPAQRYQKPIEVAQALAAFVKPGTKRASGVASPGPEASSPGTGTVIAADTSKIKAIPRDVPGEASAKEAPAKGEAASAFAGLGEPVASTKKKAKPARKTAEPVATAWYRRWPVLAGVGVLLLALLGMWASGVFKVTTKDGTIVLENLPPDAEVTVDGGTVTVKWGDGKKAEVHVAPGKKHRIQVKNEGFKVFGEEVEVDAGGSKPLLVRLEKLPEPIPPKPLPPEKQVEAVVEKLRDLNPGFDGKATPKVEGGVVTELQFVTDQVTDISPIRALTGLRVLNCSGSAAGKGQLADLSPLKGMQLTSLVCCATRVTDLSPLKGMPLTFLICGSTRVSDLSPLKGMELTYLECGDTQVSDLSPLKGMPLGDLRFVFTRVSDLSPLKDMPLLRWVDCRGTRVFDLSPLKGMQLTSLVCYFTQVSDLSPLKGMPLTNLLLQGTRVSDLSPLKGMPLTSLDCGGTRVSDLSSLKSMPLTNLLIYNTQVSDLSPLKDMQLTSLNCGGTRVSDLSPLKGMPLTDLRYHNTRVSDLSPLKGMPLKIVDCDFRPERDAEILRSIKTLVQINDKPVAQFWKEVGSNTP